MLNTDYSHPSSHVCLRFPLKISPMPPGQAESGVEARSACKHHSTMAGRTCVVVYLWCCLSLALWKAEGSFFSSSNTLPHQSCPHCWWLIILVCCNTWPTLHLRSESPTTWNSESPTTHLEVELVMNEDREKVAWLIARLESRLLFVLCTFPFQHFYADKSVDGI